MSELYNRNKAVFHIIIFTVVGLAFIYLIDYALAFKTLYSWNLSYINSLTGAFGFILSVITIYLLYINYQQQRKELHSLIDQNNDIIRESQIANNQNQIANNQNILATRLQIIISEKKAIDSILSNVDNSLNRGIQDFLAGANQFANALVLSPINYSKLQQRCGNLNKYRGTIVSSELQRIDRQIAIVRSVTENDNNLRLLANCFNNELINFLETIHFVDFEQINPLGHIRSDQAQIVGHVSDYCNEIASNTHNILYVISLSRNI